MSEIKPGSDYYNGQNLFSEPKNSDADLSVADPVQVPPSTDEDNLDDEEEYELPEVDDEIADPESENYPSEQPTPPPPKPQGNVPIGFDPFGVNGGPEDKRYT